MCCEAAAAASKVVDVDVISSFYFTLVLFVYNVLKTRKQNQSLLFTFFLVYFNQQ
jgi:hypothetical protein